MPAPRFIVADFETRSSLSIKDTVADRYATDREADILCLTFQIDGIPGPELWHPGQPFPEHLRCYIEIFELPVFFHNAGFDHAIWRNIGVPRYGFPELPLEQVYCTSACAAALNLPRSLAGATESLGLLQKKMADEGAKLTRMHGLTMPRKLTQKDSRRWWSRDHYDKAHLFRDLDEYALQDIRATVGLVEKIKHLSSFERKVWLANERCNIRGLRIDQALIQRCIELLDVEATQYTGQELRLMTAGKVERLSEIEKIKKWMAEYGLEVDSLAESAREDLMERAEELDIPPEVLRVLELLGSYSASVRKLPKMLSCASPDGRVRGLFQYCGASQTMRFSGAAVQPQNLPRPEAGINLDELREDLATRSAAVLAMTYGSVANAVRNAVRTMFIPDPGNVYVAVDLAQIELRVLLWLAGEEAALEELKGGDLYSSMASDIYDKPVNKKEHPEERQLGKNTVLGCGYQMGWRKFQITAWIQQFLRLPDELCKKAVNAYRGRFPRVVELWDDMGATAIRAMKQPGAQLAVAAAGTFIDEHGQERPRIRFRYNKGTLEMRGPSGHSLYYHQAKLHRRKKQLQREDGTPFEMEVEEITYTGPKERGGHRARLATYGGKLTENAVQHIARVILTAGMVAIDEEGIPLVLHAHDELVTEVPAEKGKEVEERMTELMTVRPSWAPTLPLAAEGWVGTYYRK